jgi:asparagine synthetase B (glutamine-hydrolysing)
MCGIAGLANCGDREVLGRMAHVQAHCGPDDSGLWERRFPGGSYVGLGRRLPFLDLSADGHMPMCNWTSWSRHCHCFAGAKDNMNARAGQSSFWRVTILE